jgi:hypothetical protein
MKNLVKSQEIESTQDIPQLTLLRMITGGQIAQAMHAAVQLNIPDLLIDGPMSVADLAQRCGAHAPTLYRLLRALASIGVFWEDSEQRFQLTETSQLLRSDIPHSLRPLLLLCHTPTHWNSWMNFVESIQTGEVSFQHLYKQEYWAYLDKNPAEQKLCYEALSSLSVGEIDAILAAYDFSPYHLIVEVAGGWGKLLTLLLQANASTQGILFDLPFVAEQAAEQIRETEVAQRCRIEAGDMFVSVPGGGDLYLLKTVCHDWDDEHLLTLLRNCRAAMKPGAKLLLIEQVLLPRNAPDIGKFLDLFLLAVIGGQERTAEEFQALIEAAGLEFERIIPTQPIIPTQSGLTIIECRKRSAEF